MRVEVDGVRVALDGVTVVGDVDLVAEPGAVVGLVGPNGSGKSTLLRAVYRVLAPTTGAVRVDGDDVWHDLTPRQAARRTAVLAQESHGDFDLSVRQVVAAGRVPHQGWLTRESVEDAATIEESLVRVGMWSRAERLFRTLSGGERQRVLLARALAQRTGVLVLDEPTNHLDVRARLELLELVADLGLTTIAALHELDLAAAYCERVYVLQAGRVVAHGPTADVLSEGLMADVFGVRAHCGTHPLTGRPHIAVAPLVVPRPTAAPPVRDLAPPALTGK